MSSNSSGYRVRRHLSFVDVPCKGKVFYVDVKLPSLKQKLTKRIHDLGGQVEPFLSKDLDLILTDGDETKTSNLNRLQNIPLSRGQALLIASKDQKGDCNNNDIIHRATLLGVKTQTVKDFIQATSKCMSQLKAQKRAQQKEKDILQGMSPISWDKDKENYYILKVEDEEAIYRPLFKQLENTPKIAYNDTGSPFDVGVVLTKHDDGNQTKKKLTKAPVKGGYCESCDHWYKSTLKEHLKSDKHQAFVASISNFRSLEIASSGLPNFNSFMRKFDTCSIIELEKSIDESTIQEKNEIREEQYIGNDNDDKENSAVNPTHGELCDKTSKDKMEIQEAINDKELDCTGFAESVCSLACGYDRSQSQSNDSVQSKDNRKPQPQINRKKLPVDAVLKDIFSDSIESNLQITKSSQVRKDGSELLEKDPCQNTNSNLTGDKVTCDNAHVISKEFAPEVNFSSSSCSFGDNGVGNVWNFLQSNESETSNRKLQTGRNSVETVSTEKSHKSSLVKGSVSSSQSAISNTLVSVPPNIDKFMETDKGKCDVSTKMCVISNVTNNKSFDPININCDLDKRDQKSCLLTVNPEYSNITEESISSEIPRVESLENMQVDEGSKCNTPCKDVSDAIKDEMMKNAAKSGSTWSSIRNWLLPADNDDTPVNKAGPDLDKTLVQDEKLNPKTDNGKLPIEENCDITNILNENLTDSPNNLVAAWIQNQEFEGKGGESEHSQHAFSTENRTLCDTHIGDCNNTCSFDIGESFKDAITTLVNPEMDDMKLIRDDSIDGRTKDDDTISDCTSISDCTLENFKVEQKKEDEIALHSNKLESRDHFETSKNWDCKSEKSSLSCRVTAKGIKIKGISSINSQSEKTDISISGQSNHANIETISKGTFTSAAFVNLNQKHGEDSSDESSKIKGFKERKSFQDDIFKDITKETIIPKTSKSPEDLNNSKQIRERAMLDILHTHCSKELSMQLEQPRVSSDTSKSFNSQNYSSQTLCQNMYSPISQASQLNRRDYNLHQVLQHNNYVQGHPIPVSVPHNNHYFSQTGVHNINDCQRIQDSYRGNTSNPGTIYGDYFNTGILPMEAQYSTYGQEYGSCLSNYNQSFSNSSFNMNGTTDFLAMSSPRHNSIMANNAHSRTSQHQVSSNNSSLPSSYQHPFTSSEEIQRCSGNSNKDISTCNPTSETKPVKNKKGNGKGAKRKRNNSQLSFLSATSSFLASNESQLSSRGLPSNVVEPASSIQSTWYQSSPLSGVSSANFSTIRIEDIAERTGEYTYPLHQQMTISASQKTHVKRENTVSQVPNFQDVCSNPFSSAVLMNHSTPSSQPIIHYKSTTAIVNNKPYIHPNCAIDTGISNPNFLPNALSYSYSTFSGSMPIPSPNTHIQSVSSTNPSQVSQQLAYSNPSQCMNTMTGGNVPTYTSSTTNLPTYPQQIEAIINPSGNVSNYQTTYSPVCTDKYSSQGCTYNAVQTGAMKLRLSKVPFSQPQQQQSDLKSYWNVRKAGDCRLVFSNPAGKRKAAETVNNCDNILYDNYGQTDNHITKRRKYLIY